MTVVDEQKPLVDNTTCSVLLQQMQEIWNEVGESEEQRDKILVQLEQECLDVYKRKVDQVAKSKAHLLQTPTEVDEQKPLVDSTSCVLVLQQLQKIWDKVGESQEQMDKMLLQLEQECLDAYKRKVDQAAKSKAHLLQTLADAKLEYSTLLASLGEKTSVKIPSGTIREQLAAIALALEQLQKQKEERVKEKKIEDGVCIESQNTCPDVNLEKNTLKSHLQSMFCNTDEQGDDEVSNIIEIASKKEASSLILHYQKEAADDTTLCIKCNKQGDLIEFTYQKFSFCVHKSCLSPYGSYTLALSEYMKAKKIASMAKQKLLAFMALGDDCADDSTKAEQKPQCTSASRLVVELSDDDDDDESLKADQKPQCTSASRAVVDLSDDDDDFPVPKPPRPPTISPARQRGVEDCAAAADGNLLVSWKPSEEQKLQEGVVKFTTANGRTSWSLILEDGKGVFHPSRNSASLRSKYNYMQKHNL